MNIFSNLGITELLVILLLALLVVGPEKLPEVGRQIGKTLRDFRRAYENLTKDLGPELASLQKTTAELRESVDSVRSIPKDVVKTVVDASGLEETTAELKGIKDTMKGVDTSLKAAGKTLKDPVGSAVSAAKKTLTEPVTSAVDAAKEGLEPGKTAPASPAASPESKAGEETDPNPPLETAESADSAESQTTPSTEAPNHD